MDRAVGVGGLRRVLSVACDLSAMLCCLAESQLPTSGDGSECLAAAA